MSTELACPVCLDPITAENPGVKLKFPMVRKSPNHKWVHPGHRGGSGSIIACKDCATTHNAGIDGKNNLAMVYSQEFTDGWERHDCQNCALPLLLEPSKLRKTPFCSDRCRVASLRASRKAVQAKVTLTCDGCGTEITGRADRRFCSTSCKQRAYRSRNVMNTGTVPAGAILDKPTAATHKAWEAMSGTAASITGMTAAWATLTVLHGSYAPTVSKGQHSAAEILEALDNGVHELQRLRALVAAASKDQ